MNDTKETITKEKRDLEKEKAKVQKLETALKVAKEISKSVNEIPVVKVVEKPQPVKISWKDKLFDTAINAGKGVWNWFTTGGLETIISLSGTSFADDLKDKLGNKIEILEKRRKLDGTEYTVVPAGTIMYNQPIGPNMFSDSNNWMTVQSSLYNWWAFEGGDHTKGPAKIKFTPAQGDLVDGQLFMFIIKDPALQVITVDVQQIDQIVREQDGKIMRVNEPFSIPLPPPAHPYLTNEDPDLLEPAELRQSFMGRLVVGAFTDLPLGGLGEVYLDTKLHLSTKMNPGLEIVNPISLSSVIISGYNNMTLSATAQAPNNATITYSSGIEFATLDSTGQYITLTPGIYDLVLFWIINQGNTTESADVLYNPIYHNTKIVYAGPTTIAQFIDPLNNLTGSGTIGAGQPRYQYQINDLNIPTGQTIWLTMLVTGGVLEDELDTLTSLSIFIRQTYSYPFPGQDQLPVGKRGNEVERLDKIMKLPFMRKMVGGEMTRRTHDTVYNIEKGEGSEKKKTSKINPIRK